MRLLIAMMKHETNTFSPVPTPLQRFRDWGLHEDEAAVRFYKNTNHPFAAYLDVAAEMGAEIVAPVAAEAMPSGPVSREAYDYLTGRILDALATKGPFDAALLDLHGAMVPEGLDDGEGPLLARMRAVAPDLPIGVTFDPHGNMTPEIMANADVVVAYKTYPHVDMHKAGMQCARIMMDMLAGKVRPVISWAPAGILAQTLRMGTDEQPMRGAVDLCLEEERREGVLAASVFGGFPMADIPSAGLSVVVVADAAKDDGRASRDRLLAYARENRTDWFHVHEPIEAAVARARAIADGPVVLLDHADNVGSGGTSDVMTAIAEVLRQDLQGVAMAAVWDPAAVQAMQAAGVGSTVTLDLGGRMAMPAIDFPARPLRVTGRVRRLSDGEWIVRGPMYTGSRITAGPTAVLEVGGMQIVVTSLHHEPWDAGIFTHIGIDPAQCRYILLKSRVHYRAGFRPYEKHRITLDGDGVTTSDNSRLTYTRLTPGTYPFN